MKDGWDGISSEGDGYAIEGYGLGVDLNPVRL